MSEINQEYATKMNEIYKKKQYIENKFCYMNESIRLFTT
jgi:hypothetical protein